MTQPRHSAPARGGSAPAPEGVIADEVWVPPPFEPIRPGDFVEYRAGGFEVQRAHPVRKVLVCLVLLAAVAGGGWWWYQHSHSGTAVDAAEACRQADAGAAAAGAPFLDVRVGGQVPAGIPLPSEPILVKCAATTPSGFSGELVAWRGASESDYQALLTAGGWLVSRHTDEYTLWINGTDHRMIITATVDQHLFAFYRN